MESSSSSLSVIWKDGPRDANGERVRLDITDIEKMINGEIGVSE